MPDVIALSLVVPTLNEAENLPELVRRVSTALAGTRWEAFELIVVDDGSRDGTPDVARGLASEYPVRLLERGADREGGLSGAVLAGFAIAQGEVLGVIDADLQHPPERLPNLLAALDEAEMVVGSRYVPGGSVGERWGAFRKLNSRVATLLAAPFDRGVRDPMSGFFALPRRVFERGQDLSPLGYKILLELLCKCEPTRVAEVPIHFGERHAGQSKLTIKEQFRYLEHLSRLYDFTFPRLSPVTKFAIVTTLAWLVGGLIFWLAWPTSETAAVALAYAGAIGVTALFHARYVRTQRPFLIRPSPWRDFTMSALIEWLVAVGSAAYLSARLGQVHVEEVFFIPFLLATVVRYIVRKELLLDVRGLRPEDRTARAAVEARR